MLVELVAVVAVVVAAVVVVAVVVVAVVVVMEILPKLTVPEGLKPQLHVVIIEEEPLEGHGNGETN